MLCEGCFKTSFHSSHIISQRIIWTDDETTIYLPIFYIVSIRSLAWGTQTPWGSHFCTVDSVWGLFSSRSSSPTFRMKQSYTLSFSWKHLQENLHTYLGECSVCIMHGSLLVPSLEKTHSNGETPALQLYRMTYTVAHTLASYSLFPVSG